jgi:hypothetical protein
MGYVIPSLKVDIASGRVEKPTFSHKKFALCANFLCEKIKKYHAAAGEATFLSGQTSGLITHRITHVTD